MELTNELLKQIKEKRMIHSDSDSNIICLLIDKIFEQQKEIERCEDYLNELGFTRYDWTDEK